MLYYNQPTDDFTCIIDTKLGFSVEIVTHEDLDYRQSLYTKPEYRSWYDLMKDFPTAIPVIKRQLMEDIRNKVNVKDARQKLAYLSPMKNKTGQITPDLIHQAKQRNISDFIKVPSSRKVQCIFHSDKAPSMHVYPRSFYCFSCQAHGSTIDFIMKQQSKTFKESVLFLTQ
jgi:hypothetical protein